jgi:hypothetical protein
VICRFQLWQEELPQFLRELERQFAGGPIGDAITAALADDTPAAPIVQLVPKKTPK